MTTDTSGTAAAGQAYVCRYCRLNSDAAATSCPHCGAPIDVRAIVSRSGWVKQPGITDMARIQFGQSRVQIEGTQVPVADFDLAGQEWIYFSHHSLLWSDPSVRLSNSGLAGGWNRMLAGMPLIMMEARGPGHLALSHNHAGDVVALPLMPGQQVWVREHRFLTATGNIAYTWENTNIWYVTGSGDDRETHYPMGMLGDRFTAHQSPGLLLLHSPGNTFLRDLAPGETILVQPSALLYRDLSVNMHLHLEYPRGQGISWWASFEQRNIWLRLIGPGRVAVQSIFERPESERITDHSPATLYRW
jgi:uncharacterized protein (AIM24 family)